MRSGADNMQKVYSATPAELARRSTGSEALQPRSSKSGRLLKTMTADLKDILQNPSRVQKSFDRWALPQSLNTICIKRPPLYSIECCTHIFICSSCTSVKRMRQRLEAGPLKT